MNRTTLLTCSFIATLLAFVIYVALRNGDQHDESARRTSATLADCSAMWREGFEAKGSVGGRETHAYFDMRPMPGASEQVSGVVRFPDETGKALADTLIGLVGPLSDDRCFVQFRNADTEGDAWRLHIKSTVMLTGTRQTADGRTAPIDFSIVAETPCDGASEWRTFRSPGWPITFDYPASWTLIDDEDDITIECASITALATTRPSLTFERGRFHPTDANRAVRTQESFSEPYWFIRLAGDDWRVGRDCGQSDGGRQRPQSCPPARRSERSGMTVLQGAAGDHRLYRPGVGYLGQGGGITRYLFILGEEWISLDSAGESSHDGDIGDTGGPVLYEGERIGDRVVRSVAAR